MKKDSFSTIKNTSGNAYPFEKARIRLRSNGVRSISEEKLWEIFADVKQKLGEGMSGAAEKILTNMLENYSHSRETEAKFRRLLSYTYETQGRYKKALEAIEKYDDDDILGE